MGVPAPDIDAAPRWISDLSDAGIDVIITVPYEEGRRGTYRAILAGATHVLNAPVKPRNLVSLLADRSLRRNATPALAAKTELLKRDLSSLRPRMALAKALVVDDVQMNRDVVAKQLAEFGLASDVAADGQAALEKVRESSYAIVFVDCAMPTMDGYEFTARLRAYEKKSGSHLPVVALTASALSGDADRCFEAGMDDYLSKPVSLRRLSETAERWILGGGPLVADDVPVAPGSPATRSESPIDLAQLSDLLGSSAREPRDAILTKFLQAFPPLMTRITDAHDRNQGAEVRDAAHAARGVAAQVCATSLCERLSVLERRGDEAHAPAGYGATIEAEYRRAAQFIEQLVEKRVAE